MVTIKDVAAHTGLSFQTVSRILAGKGAAHNEETRQRVLTAASQLGYRPHSSARTMRQGRFESVALLLSEKPWLSLLSSRLRDGILDALAERETNLILARLPDANLTNERRMPRILRELSADGLLINYNDDIPEKMIALIKEHNMPAIWINSVHEADCVYPDDIAAGRIATQHLLKAGHERIAYLHWSPGHYSHRHREAGYREAMHAAGRPDTSLLFNMDYHQMQQDLESIPWLVGPGRYTGFFCYAPDVALRLFFAAVMLGLRIPQDLSVVVCADEPGRIMDLDVDTVMLPYHTMGREAVAMLTAKIQAPATLIAPKPLLPTLQPGSTVGTPRYHSGRP